MLAIALATLLALIVPAPAVAAVDCAPVHVIGVRGSGQTNGFGDQVGAVVDALGAEAGPAFTTEALDYEAISLADSFGLALLDGRYAASIADGADRLLAAMAAHEEACPDSRLVLVGYSQGAQVIKRALVDAQPIHPIGAVVLLADPNRDPQQRGILRLGDPAVERAGALGAVALPNHLRAVAIDVCAAGDGICERGRRSFTAHVDGYEDPAPLVARAVRAELASVPVPVGVPR